MFMKTAIAFASLVASAMIVVAVPAHVPGHVERPGTEIAIAGIRGPLPQPRPELIPAPEEVPRPRGSLELALAGTQGRRRGALAMIRPEMAPPEFMRPELMRPEFMRPAYLPREPMPMTVPEAFPERPEIMEPPSQLLPIMNSGYIEGFFPGAFVSGVGGRDHSIGFARPESNVRSPGRVYVSGGRIAAPERVVGLRLASPGPDIRGQGIRTAGAFTRPEIEARGRIPRQ